MPKNPLYSSMFAGYDGPIIDPVQARKMMRARRILKAQDKKASRNA